MSLRGEDKPAADDKGRVATHVQNKEGRVFIATPALLEKEDMRPIFDGDPEEIKKINSNLDLLEKRGMPGHVRNKEGRVFIASEALCERGDMEFLYDYKPGKAGKKADDRFVLNKATKQKIADEGSKLFGVDISQDQGLKEMRAEFTGLEDTQAQKVIYVAGVKAQFDVDLDVNDSIEDLEEQVRDLVLGRATVEEIAAMALKEFGIKMDAEVEHEAMVEGFKILADSDEDYLEEIRADQKENSEPEVKGSGSDDKKGDDQSSHSDADVDGGGSDEGGESSDITDKSGDESDNKGGDKVEE